MGDLECRVFCGLLLQCSKSLLALKSIECQAAPKYGLRAGLSRTGMPVDQKKAAPPRAAPL
jgi:hypothetical protein